MVYINRRALYVLCTTAHLITNFLLISTYTVHSTHKFTVLKYYQYQHVYMFINNTYICPYQHVYVQYKNVYMFSVNTCIFSVSTSVYVQYQHVYMFSINTYICSVSTRVYVQYQHVYMFSINTCIGSVSTRV